MERRYAATADPAGELAELVAAAHARDIEVWLDVVFNHTTEVDETGPVYNLRGLADADFYRLDERGWYIETTGCGNDLDVTSEAARRLVLEALDRFADLGVDGFRFDLAPVLSRHRPFIAELDTWAARRRVRMIAEPWDAAGRHELGRAWPGRGWLQWNDRFREDVRGFLRAEPGMVGALRERIRGSPDVFDAPLESVNFVTCHDGFTMYDLVAYDRKHNLANGEHNDDGAHHNRSWNCGWEGDADVPDEVAALRQRQLRNAWCLLAMAHGVPMVTMGDEFGRTQGGNNNAHNQDNATSWVDWERRDRFADLERFVAELLALRHRHRVLSQPEWWGDGAVVVRGDRRARPVARFPLSGVERRRPLRDGQRLVGAAGVQDPGAGCVAPDGGHLVAGARRHRGRRRAGRRGELRRRRPLGGDPRALTSRLGVRRSVGRLVGGADGGHREARPGGRRGRAEPRRRRSGGPR